MTVMGVIEKFLRKLFDSGRKYFESGGKLERLSPFFDATESFLFIPAIEARNRPYIRDGLDVKRFMSIVILALLPPLIFGIYNTGYQSLRAAGDSLQFVSVMTRGTAIVLPIIAVSYGVGFFWEILFAVIRKHPISEGLLVTGLLFPMTLPPTIPLWQVAVGISFGVVIGKEVFGGTGRNIFNPALTGRAFLFFAYPSKMSGDVWVAAAHMSSQAMDAVTHPTPLAITAVAPPHATIEATLQASGYTLSKLFWGLYPGTVAGTSILYCLIGAVILIATGVGSYRIMAGGVIGLLFSGFILNLLSTPESMPWFSIHPVYHLVVGGFAFGLVYMATDPVSSPGTEKAKWIYGFFIGALTVLIRVVNPAYPEGVMMAILFMNLFAPLLDYIEIRLHVHKRIPNV
jgi:Na+-transporting NADH:ubiquinone oxidoreductase subunit B